MPSETSPTDLDTELAKMESATAAPHPEEMKGTVNLNVGKWISVTASGRATPAGLICAALLLLAIAIPVLRRR
jgi:hypothetical protein